MAIYHFTASKGQQGKHSAKAKFDYIHREGKYQKDVSEVVISASGNMPDWVHGDIRRYWKAADDHERVNGRLFRHYEFSLPKELTAEEQKELANAFCQEVATAKEGNLPYSYAIHHGKGKNPHCHLMISERVNDGHARASETWFMRANKKELEKGGAVKAESLERKEWLLETRKKWADRVNQALKLAGIDTQIDHRNLEQQGIVDRIAMPHIGPHVLQMEEKGIATKKGQKALGVVSKNGRHRTIEGSEELTGFSRTDRAVGTEHGGSGGRFASGDGGDSERGGQNQQNNQREDRISSGWLGDSEFRIEKGVGRAFTEFTDSKRENEGLRGETLPYGRDSGSGDRDSSTNRIGDLARPIFRESGQGEAVGRSRGEFCDMGRANTKAFQLDFVRKVQAGNERTTEAVKNQVRAMGCQSFEIGIREQKTGKMMHRAMTVDKLLESVPWLKRMNAQGNDIYIRPARAEARALVLVDDINGITIDEMRKRGISPACVVQTSHKNLQAWVSMGEKPMPDAQRTELAKAFAKELGGDEASADGRHFGRLSGFTNRKPEYLQDNGFPYVLCKESSGQHAEKSERLRMWAEQRVHELEQAQKRVEMALGRAEAIKTAQRTYLYNEPPAQAYKAFMQEWLKRVESQGQKPDWSKGDYAVACRMLVGGKYSNSEIAKAIEEHSPDIPTRKEGHAADYAKRTVEAAERNPKVQQELLEQQKTAEHRRSRSRGPSLGR